jgi:hypothetical protein
MNITIEKLLHGIGFLIRAVFLIAWNLGKMGFAVFLVFLGILIEAPPVGLEPVHLRELSLRQEDWLYWDD